jgi:SPP1 gp7 family putative phage head morphogenesis protein
MKLKTLKPIRADRKIESKIKDKIIEVLKHEIYLPLILEVGIKNTKLENSMDDLLKAIRSGQLSYVRGRFTGKYNSTLSRELRRIGAEWNRSQGSWSIPQSKLPIEIKNAIAVSKSKFMETVSKVDKKLQSLQPEKIAEKISLKEAFDTSLYEFDEKFIDSLKAITVQPKLSKKQIDTISEEYSENMKLYIRDFVDEEVKKLRKEVEANVMAGMRYENLVDTIQKSYGVSQNKAKFLARQESNLLVAKFREVRYREVGLEKYEWRCVAGSAEHPVRDSHLALDGKIFSWDNPPVTTMPGKPQRRNHPGEDYNCRCLAVPVLEFE